MSGELNREFQEQLPRKPYCSNELAAGLTVEEVSAACGASLRTVRRGVAKTDTLGGK